MTRVSSELTPASLEPALSRFWELSAAKIRLIERAYDRGQGSPVFTVGGSCTTRGWTEWTQGFEFGSAVLQYDATGVEEFLGIGRSRTLAVMAPHVTHFGVHDHGFNNVSTYGNLLRLGHWLRQKGDETDGSRYWQAGLTVLSTLLREPYLSVEPDHQGLILHSVYHRPNGWDHVPPGRRVPCGESSMWGDYHAREAALYVQRIAADEPYLTFWGA